MKNTYLFIFAFFIAAIITFIIMYCFHGFSLIELITPSITCGLISGVVAVIRNRKEYQ